MPALKATQRILSAAASDTPEQQYDVIVVGSGMGGMTTAAMLARHSDMKVLVLEAHKTELGGSMHRFKINPPKGSPYTKTNAGAWFTAGYHYVGGDRRMRQWIDYCCDAHHTAPVKWKNIGGHGGREISGYDTVVLSHGTRDFEYNTRDYYNNDNTVHTAYDDVRCSLYVRFTERREREAADKYVALVEGTAAYLQRVMALKILPICAYGPALRLMNCIHAWTHPEIHEVFQMSVFDVITRRCNVDHGSDLFTALTGQAGLYGGNLERVPFYVHAACVDHYANNGGGYRFDPADDVHKSIPRSMHHTIRKYGGGDCRVDCRAIRVSKPHGAAQKVATVTVEHRGVEYEITPKKALVLAIGTSNVRKLAGGTGGGNTLESTSTSHYQMFVGFAGTHENLQLPRENVWFNNVGSALTDAGITRVFVSFTPNHGQPLHTQACIVAETTLGSCDENVCDDIERMLMKLITAKWPSLLSCGEPTFQEGGNPMVAAHYLNTHNGASYGAAHSVARTMDPRIASWFHPETTMPTAYNPYGLRGKNGFYLSGQDACMPGIAGAVSGGVLCATRIVGLTYPMLTEHLL